MRTVVVAVVASLSASVGEVLVSQGMKTFGERDWSRPSEWLALVLVVLRNPQVLAGVVFMAGFFFLFLAALTWSDLSFFNPLTALSYVFTAILCHIALGEDVSWRRWLGTLVVMVGVVLITSDAANRAVVPGSDPRPPAVRRDAGP